MVWVVDEAVGISFFRPDLLLEVETVYLFFRGNRSACHIHTDNTHRIGGEINRPARRKRHHPTCSAHKA
jgi:hypothetical protein